MNNIQFSIKRTFNKKNTNYKKSYIGNFHKEKSKRFFFIQKTKKNIKSLSFKHLNNSHFTFLRLNFYFAKNNSKDPEKIKNYMFKVNAFKVRSYFYFKGPYIKFKFFRRIFFNFKRKNYIYKSFYFSNIYNHFNHSLNSLSYKNIHMGYFINLHKNYNSRHDRLNVVCSTILNYPHESKYLLFLHYFYIFCILKPTFKTFNLRLTTLKNFPYISFLILFRFISTFFFECLSFLERNPSGNWLSHSNFFAKYSDKFNFYVSNFYSKKLNRNFFFLLDLKSRWNLYIDQFQSNIHYFNFFDHIFYESINLNLFVNFFFKRLKKIFKYIFLNQTFNFFRSKYLSKKFKRRHYIYKKKHFFFRKKRVLLKKKKKVFIFSIWFINSIKNKFFFKKIYKFKNSWWFHFCRQSGFFLTFFSYISNLNKIKKNTKTRNLKYKYKNILKQIQKQSLSRYSLRRDFEWVSTGISISLLPVFTKSYYRSLFRLTSIFKLYKFKNIYKLFYYYYYKYMFTDKNFFSYPINYLKRIFKRRLIIPRRKSILLSINYNFLPKFLCSYKEINFKLRYLSFFSNMLNDKFNLKVSVPKTYFKLAIGGIYKHF